MSNDFDINFYVHSHCHQKALVGRKSLPKMMKQVTGVNVEYIDSGCCGMAGSFGYEEENHEHSRKMAERKLVPEIEESGKGSVVVAPGLSCRQQIDHFTGKTPNHPSEVLASAVLNSDDH